MKNAGKVAFWVLRIIVGTSIFALGFDLFLAPNELTAGGLSGLAMILVYVLRFGTVGTITALINLPLFIISGKKIGKKFFVGSLIGMLSLSVAIDAFTFLPVPNVEPLIAVLYGAALCGVGAGIVFVAGASTGGSDIVVRLLKMRYQHIPIGTITMCFDAVVAILTGLVFQDVSRALYSGIAIFVTGTVLDAVVYRFDYSKVAIIISKEYETIAREIGTKLNRGSTYLYGQGVYKGEETKVVLTAVKRQQIAELKALVSEIDPNAFIIVQEAHQVLGDGFARYSKESL
jgi:uncharacterized membrane-anchored protein YitT (DUF2179 family)